MSFVEIKEWRKDSVDKLVSDWSMSVKADAPHLFYDSYDGRMSMSLGFFYFIDLQYYCILVTSIRSE